MDKLYTTTEVTVDDLTPGSFYTFTVTAIGSGDLESNSVTCVGSTGESVEICSIVYINQINVIIMVARRLAGRWTLCFAGGVSSFFFIAAYVVSEFAGPIVPNFAT